MLKDLAPTNVAGYGPAGCAALAPKSVPGPFRTAKTLNVHILHPLADRRWDDLVARHRHASVFHHRGWLEALSRTYGYEPLVLTSSPDGSTLESGMVVCRVSSWLTGTRLVSLPFTDHCEPLLSDPAETRTFTKWLRAECDRNRQQYVELRPLSEIQITESGLKPTGSYWLHELDLGYGLEQIFRRLHKNSFQRKIRRAERERLSYEVGRSRQLVDEFYQLLLMTRRRHHLLPQPRSWFKNLVECMGDKAEIRIARKCGTPIAAMLTLRHRSLVVFKYGCSNAAFHNLGGIPFLFWRLIEECKLSGAEKIDLGRSELDHKGLVVFKDRLGASKRLLTYYRYTNAGGQQETAPWQWRGFREILCNSPDAFFSTAGSILYRHMG
jgi:CelD/BcsL family acetyltransferase involved in cellulose biosynthesis